MTSPLQRKLKITGPTVVTANRLIDGAAIWLTQAGSWTDSLIEAEVVDTSDAALRLLDLAHGDEREAVGAYPAPVRLSPEGKPQPGNLRERIRAAGPTISVPGAL